MRVAIVENMAGTHHGQVGIALAEAAVLTDVFRPFADRRLPGAGYDGLIVFGGTQDALDDAGSPYIAHLMDLMRTYHAADRPVLGICLGAQILARAHGAANLIGAAPEIGWHALGLTEAGRADPVIGAVADGTALPQWHADTFTLPPDALHLAATAKAPMQAFRIGRASYGTQFHFEANTRVMQSWLTFAAAQAERLSPGYPARHAALAARHGPAADAAGLALARAWVRLLGT
jgi:GMP synthase-like glutamine amidotransferase